MNCDFCDPVTANVVSRTGGGCKNLLTDQVEWQFSWAHNRPGEAEIARPECGDCEPQDWCDILQFRFGDCVMYSGPVLDADIGAGDILSIGHSAFLQKRIWTEDTTLSGPPELIWNRIWETANAPAPTGIVDSLAGSSEPVLFDVKCGDELWDVTEKLLGIHLGYTEAFGRMCSFVDNPTGPAISSGWFLDQPTPTRVGASRADQVLITFNDGNGKAWCPPLGAELPGCAGLQETFELDEIRDQETADEKACEIQAVFSRPAVELVAQGSQRLDWESGLFEAQHLKPGTRHPSNFDGSRGEIYTLDEVVFSGRGDCLVDVEARWLSGREEIARRFRADA